MSQVQRNKSQPKKGKGRKPRPNPRILPSLAYTSFTDYNQLTSDVTAIPTSVTLLTSIQGLLQTYPQHCTPTYQGAIGFRLRQKIYISHIEMRALVVGAQSNALVSADLFNSLRMAMYIGGPSFQNTSQLYLQSVAGSSTLLDVDRLLLDETVSLPTQAFDAASGYNVPQVKNIYRYIPVHREFIFYSQTPSGTANWETEKCDLLFDTVSDSSVIPHPTIEYSMRIFFEYRS